MNLKKTDNKIEEFKKFLSNSGVEFLIPTNKYEVLRFRGSDEIGIVYCNGKGDVTSFSPQAEKAWEAFENKKIYVCVNRVSRTKKSLVIRTLLKRDGEECFYCGITMKNGEASLEHLFSINQGGTNHISNLALAHFDCNFRAGHLSVSEKVKLRESLREKKQNGKEQSLSLKDKFKDFFLKNNYKFMEKQA